MSLTLNLGVLDVSYSDASGDGTQTTGDVAEGLETGFDDAHTGGYHIMQKFFDSRKDKIAQWLADDMAASIQTLVNTGGRVDTSGRGSSASHQIAGKKRTVSGEQSGTYTYGADQKIEAEFRAFIFSGEMQTVMGAISAAADAGKTKRTKSGYTKGHKARPAFVDTGLYVASFRAWTEEK